MRIRFTKRYVALSRKIPPRIGTIADKKLNLLLTNPQHPSLRLHKLRGHVNWWEISVTMKYRILFRIENDEYVLHRIGAHDILENL